MVTGFVLAGGQSRRMGRDKAFLPTQHGTLIELVSRRLRASVDRVVVIGHPRNAPRLTACAVGEVVTDLALGFGPLMGIYTGLMMTQSDLNVFLPCDMPWVDGRLITRLLTHVQQQVEVVASAHPLEGMQPFPLVCHRRATRAVGRLLSQGVRSIQMWLGLPEARVITVAEPWLWRSFANINTVADYLDVSSPHALPR